MLFRSAQYCNYLNPWRGQIQVKLQAAYPLPGGFRLAATYQDLPGNPQSATRSFSNAEIQPSLGRPLSGGVANVTVPLIDAGEMQGERVNQLDIRLGKAITVGRLRATPSLDIYNVFNANPVLTVSPAYATWQRPQSILNARFLKLVLQMDF